MKKTKDIYSFRKYTYLIFFWLLLLVTAFSVFSYFFGSLLVIIGSLPFIVFLGLYVFKFLNFIEINKEKLIIKNLLLPFIFTEYKRTDIIDISAFYEFFADEEEPNRYLFYKFISIKTETKTVTHRMDYSQKYFLDLERQLIDFDYKFRPFNGKLLGLTSSKKQTKVKLKNSKQSQDELVFEVHNYLSNMALIIKAFLFLIGLLSIVLIFQKGDSILIFLNIAGVILSPLLIITLYKLLSHLFFGKQYIVFNKANQYVKIPKSKYSRQKITIPFNNMMLYKVKVPTYRGDLIKTVQTRLSNEYEIGTGIWTLHKGEYAEGFVSYLVNFMGN